MNGSIFYININNPQFIPKLTMNEQSVMGSLKQQIVDEQPNAIQKDGSQIYDIQREKQGFIILKFKQNKQKQGSQKYHNLFIPTSIIESLKTNTTAQQVQKYLQVPLQIAINNLYNSFPKGDYQALRIKKKYSFDIIKAVIINSKEIRKSSIPREIVISEGLLASIRINYSIRQQMRLYAQYFQARQREKMQTRQWKKGKQQPIINQPLQQNNSYLQKQNESKQPIIQEKCKNLLKNQNFNQLFINNNNPIITHKNISLSNICETIYNSLQSQGQLAFPIEIQNCPNCIQYLQQFSSFQLQEFGFGLERCIAKVGELKMDQQQLSQLEKQKILRAVCSIFNSSCLGGYLFVGVCQNKKGISYIKGVQLSKLVKNSFQEQIALLIKSSLEPKNIVHQILNSEINKQKLFTIDFIPVFKNFSTLKEKYKKPGKLNDINNFMNQIFQGFYVIRIRFEFAAEYSKYLFYISTLSLKNNKQEESSYQIVRSINNDKKICKGFNVAEISHANFYNRMHAKYRNYTKKIKNIQAKSKQQLLIDHSGYIKCSKPLLVDQLQCKIQLKNQIKSGKICVASNIFGRAPNKKYQHESLLIATNCSKNQKYLKKLLNDLDKRKIIYDIYEPYEKLGKYSKRDVYYVTHQNKYTVLNAIVASLNTGKKPDLLLFDIRKQLILLKSQQVFSALERLNDTFKKQFTENFLYGKKEVFNPKQDQWEEEVYFQFLHINYAIFAFIALEYSNIRCNFINLAKLDGITMHEI